MAEIEDHKRILQPITGPAELRLLRWLASKTPQSMGPDTMTVIGIIGSIVIFVSYWLTRTDDIFLWLASAGFVINWYGDSMDGTLARYRKIERPKYGFFVDHTVDVASEALVFIGLGLSPYARFDVAVMGLVGYLMLSVYIYVRTAVDGVFKISYAGFGPTELRIIVIMANTAIFFWGNPTVTLAGASITALDWALVVVAAALMTVFLVNTISHAMRLRKVGE